MRYFQSRDFLDELKRLRRAGGQSKNASEKIQALLFRIQSGEANPFSGLKTTNRGETRLKNCVKYDISGFCRLVTVVYGDNTLFLFIGTHDDVSKWLEKNKGVEFTVDETMEVGLTHRDPDNIPEYIDRNYNGKLFERLDKKWRNEISGNLTYSEMEAVLELDAGVEDWQINDAVRLISSQKVQDVFCDVLKLLNRGDIAEAQNRIKLFLNKSKLLDEVPPGETISVQGDTGFREIIVGSKEYRKWLENFLKSEHAFAWFLFMHSDQQKLVDEDYKGPVKLSGVSGSGKTAVAIKRAIRLAEKYDGAEILLVTINKSLAQLISDVLQYACNDKNITNNIKVSSFADLAYEMLTDFDSTAKTRFKFTSEVLEEHKDEVYREFYRCLLNNKDAEVLLPTHRLLVSQGIDAERYIYEEFDWIRSICASEDRESYLTVSRKGRAYPLGEDQRRRVLEGLAKWERKMQDVGVVDAPGLTMEVLKHLKKIMPKYRATIVDEAQDFGTTELQIIRAITHSNENDLFLCGDGAQQVQAKQQNLIKAGINISGRSFKLEKNYRNSKEVLEVAHQILLENLSEEHFDLSELDISDPKFAHRSSPKPFILEAESIEEEIASAIQLMRDNTEVYEQQGTDHIGCIAIAGFSLFEVEEFGKKINFPVLSGEKTSKVSLNLKENNIVFSDLEQTKGYEFDTMIIINCRETILPPVEMPREEMYRFVSQFYVAMTRAKHQLIFSFSNQLSHWLSGSKLDLPIEKWFDYVDVNLGSYVGVPGKLPEFPGEQVSDILDIDGTQFIYTAMARGLPSSLLERIPKIIDGKGLISNQKRVRWKSVSEAVNDLRGDGGRGKYEIFGPSSDANILDNIAIAKAQNTIIMTRSEMMSSSVGEEKLPYKNSVKIKTSVKVEKSSNSEDDPISELKLPKKLFVICHSLGLKYVKDIKKLNTKTNGKLLSRSEITALHRLVKYHVSNAVKDPSFDVINVQPSIDKRLLEAFDSLGIRNLQQLKSFSERDLLLSSRIGRAEVEKIKKISKSFGIKMKSN